MLEYRLLRKTLLRRFLAHSTSEEWQHDIGQFDDAINRAITQSAVTYAAARDEGRELVLAILGHDLRNPVSAISATAAALLTTAKR